MPVTETDILIYIALAEELRHIIDAFSIKFKPDELDIMPLTYYSGQIPSVNGEKKYKIVLVAAGTMGNTNSAAIGSSLVSVFKPKNLVVLGVAGSVSNDLNPGDVFIPSRVTEYAANSAAVGGEDLKFKASGNHHACNRRLLDRFQNFSITHATSFDKWQNMTEENLKKLVTKEMFDKLHKANIKLKTRSELKVGDDKSLLSGPTVAKSSGFLTLVKSIDRKGAAIEMESAGIVVLNTVLSNGPRVLAIRGISDPASEDKEELEKIVGESARKVCMKNAVQLLELSIREDVFRDEPNMPAAENVAAEIKLATTIKKVFIVGGATGDGGDTDYSKEDLRQACQTIGEKLAKAGIELIVCSPFVDSADYFAANGYASAKAGGKVNYHFPANADVISRKAALEHRLKTNWANPPEIVNWQHAAYLNEQGLEQAWLLSQIQALEQADAVVAIGGKDSSSANTLLHLAEIRKIPIVPFTVIGGAASKLYNRIDWKKLYPGINKSSLSSQTGYRNVVDLLKRISVFEVRREVAAFGKISTVFISRATLDTSFADLVRNHLVDENFTVLFGDDAIVEEREVIPSIQDFMVQSQLFIALWSKSYALSRWCNDELEFAISRANSGQMKVIIVLIDETPVIPKNARTLITIKVQDIQSLTNTLDEIFNAD